MSANFIDDLSYADQDTVEITGPAYPVAQWLNGDPKLAAVGGVAHTGGLILPEKYVPADFAPAPGWARTTVAFASGKTETVLASAKPLLAVIRTRFRWFVNHNGVVTYYPRAGYIANTGMRGHVQVLCGVRGFDFPLVVTFKGKAGQAFEILATDFAQKVAEATARLIREKKAAEQTRRFPRFAFYLRLAPGPHTKAGQKGQESIITPPQADVPSVISEEYLGKVYVGRERLLELQETYRAAAEWVAEWDRGGAEAEGSDQPPAEADPETGEIIERPAAAAPRQPQPERPVDSNGLMAHIKQLSKPSEAAKFLTNINGPTVYWTTVKAFLIDQQTAVDINNEAKGDWKRALSGLDKQVEPF